MKRLWAPWRIEYMLNSGKTKGCILCDKPREKHDVANYILFRGKLNFIILNAYPYSPGHLMIAPYRHVGNLIDLKDGEAKEHVELTQLCVKLLTDVITPAGFNIGMNIGKVAGAGIESHIHTHVVPRWNGDSNFMSVIADTRVLSEGLNTMYSKLKKGLANLEE